MDAKLATVKAPRSDGDGTPRTAARRQRTVPRPPRPIRLELAEAWGEMGAAWGVTPAIARVQAYLMARQEPLTEREVREALGLSPSRGQPGPRRGRVVGDRRAGAGAAAGRSARAGRCRVPRHRGPLAVVRPGHRRAQDPRRRPDRRRPRGEGRTRPRAASARASGRRGARRAARLAVGVPRVREAVRPGRRASSRSSSRANSNARCSSSVASRTPRSCACSTSSAACRTTTSSNSSRRCRNLSPTAARRATKLMSGVVRTVSR